MIVTFWHCMGFTRVFKVVYKKIYNNKFDIYIPYIVYKDMGARFAPYDLFQFIIIRGRGKKWQRIVQTQKWKELNK